MRLFLLPFSAVISFLAGTAGIPAATLEIRKGDTICLIGNTFAERLQMEGHWETLLHSRYPDFQLTVRNLAWSADPVTVWKESAKFRPANCPTPDDLLTEHGADVIIAAFGMVESFETPLEQLRADLIEFIDHTLEQKYNMQSAPRLALVSPIAHEDLADSNLPDATKHNAALAGVVALMRSVCAEKDVPFLDLFNASRPLYLAGADAKKHLTINGIHLNAEGVRQIVGAFDQALFGPRPADSLSTDQMERLRAEVKEKDWQFFKRYRPVNPYYVYGGRAEPFGVKSFPPEMAKLDAMIANRDRRIWDLARGKNVPEPIDDSNTPAIPPTPTKDPAAHARILYLAPEESMAKTKVLEGFEMHLFASEREFPELANPVQFAFDARGRLWVAVMPIYPQYLPGQKPNDKILILEDKNADGKADGCTIFAEGLYLPTGLELGDGGAYVAQEPNLVFLKDTDGDDRADVRETILHGFGTEDSHHAMHAFTWDNGGALYFMEGTFHHSQVETPHGITRLYNAGAFRFEPRTQRLGVFVSYGFANPWGLVFDEWGQPFLADASGGANYYATAFSGHIPYPQKHGGMEQFTTREMHMRPTAGCDFVRSRQWPDEFQGCWLLNNCIGFQGTRMYRLEEKGSDFQAVKTWDLLASKDLNFRPVDMEFAPDGSLFICDWHEPLIGHMQYSLRDPYRDHAHGRIYRVTAKGRPLSQPPKIAGESIETLLGLLRSYENRIRDRVRGELRSHPSLEVVAATRKWVASLDSGEAQYEHLLCEALWVQQHHNVIDVDLVKKLLGARDPRARCVAVRVFRNYWDRISETVALLKKSANDEHPRVRLEAITAASYLDNLDGVEVALEATRRSVGDDYYLSYAMAETMKTLDRHWQKALQEGKPVAAGNPNGIAYIIANVSNESLPKLPKTPAVWQAYLTRDGISAVDRRAALMALSQEQKMAPGLWLAMNLKSCEHGSAARHLAEMLLELPSATLAASRPSLLDAAMSAKTPDARAAAFAAVIMVDGDAQSAFDIASASAVRLKDFLSSINLIKGEAIREKLFPVIKELAAKLPETVLANAGHEKDVAGRFVRIDLAGKKVLSLAEVEIFSSGRNIGLTSAGGFAKQSSTEYQAWPNKATDGNTSGRWKSDARVNTITHTQEEQADPWWEVDLGSEQPIDSIVVWNRTDGRLSQRLDGYRLSILDAQKRPVWARENNRAPAPRTEHEVSGNTAFGIRIAALRALSSLSGHEAERAAVFVEALAQPALRSHAIAALAKLGELTANNHAKVASAVTPVLKNTPMEAREKPEFKDAAAVAEMVGLSDLAATESLQVITMTTPPLSFKFDPSEVSVKANQPCVIVFSNPDDKPHNLLLMPPGTLDQTVTTVETNAAELVKVEFVPADPKPLCFTEMVQANETARLYFRAPAMAADYPFICTFPGHGRLMNGVLHVK
ncbi:MAG: PVC-type heme-binding CxxCH protein [Verrucomicrobiales bacterium]